MWWVMFSMQRAAKYGYTEFWLENLKGEDHVGELEVDGR
jgi:hypothetical protein